MLGLDMGADDYVTKPFSPRELRARIKARCCAAAAPDDEPVHRFGDCEVDFARAELRRGGTAVDLTAIEFKMLQAFLRSRGPRPDARSRLIDEVWGRDVFVTDRVVDNHVVNLRKKIEPDPAEPRHLVSVRGIGYRFDG